MMHIKAGIMHIKAGIMHNKTMHFKVGIMHSKTRIIHNKAETKPRAGKKRNKSGAYNAQQGTNNAEQSTKKEISGLKHTDMPGLESTIITEKPNVKWSDVAGLERAKQALQEAVIWPVNFPQFFTGKRRPWKSILLYGPPGTGKSYLAKAVATETSSTFFSASSSDLITRWYGDSEKQISDLFQMARQMAPSIIFIDEIDSLCAQRGGHHETSHTRRVKTEFLVQMQGVGRNDGEKVLVLAATNTPYILDQAIRRRFDKRIYIPLPDLKARQHIFKVHLGDTPHNLTENDFEELAKRSDGFSGSDISVCVNDVLYQPVRKTVDASYFVEVSPGKWGPCEETQDGAVEVTLQDLQAIGLGSQVHPPPITRTDFEKVLATQRPTVSKADLEEHISFTEEFGEEEVHIKSAEVAPAVLEADSDGVTPSIPKPIPTVSYGKQFPDISRIEVFNGDNFKRWQERVFSILDMHEVAFALTDPKPAALSPQWAELWSHANKVCRHTIINTLSNELFDVYCSYKEAKEIWDSMITKYTVKDAARQKLLIEKNYNWEMRDEDIKLQVHEYQKLIEDLKSENIILQEEFVACLLIEKLPQSWNAYKQQLKLNRERLSLSDLIANIIIEDTNRQEFRVLLEEKSLQAK